MRELTRAEEVPYGTMRWSRGCGNCRSGIGRLSCSFYNHTNALLFSINNKVVCNVRSKTRTKKFPRLLMRDCTIKQHKIKTRAAVIISTSANSKLVCTQSTMSRVRNGKCNGLSEWISTQCRRLAH